MMARGGTDDQDLAGQVDPHVPVQTDARDKLAKLGILAASCPQYDSGSLKGEFPVPILLMIGVAAETLKRLGRGELLFSFRDKDRDRSLKL